MIAPRWVREKRASRRRRLELLAKIARGRVDTRFDVGHGQVGEPSNGALILALAKEVTKR